MVRRAGSIFTRRVLVVLLALAGAVACKPSIEGRPSLLDRSSVLAVKSVPAEAVPGTEAGVDLTALFASPDPDASPSSLDWALCNARKAIAVIGPAALECLAPSGKSLAPIGKGESVHTTIDKEDCSVFGPSPPTVKENEPAPRPADPDITGGYYQPVRVLVPTDGDPAYVVGVTRLVCGLAGATQDQSLDYADRYRPNENPAIEQLIVGRKGNPDEAITFADMPSDVPTVSVSRGERVTFTVTWRSCPTTPACGDMICGAGEYAMDRQVMGVPVMGCPGDCMVPRGCTGSEPYVVLDPVQRRIVDHREAMLVSWYATDGTYDHDSTGRTEEEAKHADSKNEWVAPNVAGKVRMWAVLRDDRGGVGWAELSIDVGG